MRSQYIRNTCDACGKSFDFNPQAPTPEQLAELGQWTTVAREHLAGDQLIPVVRHVCSEGCIQRVLIEGKLDLPRPKAPVGKLNLSDLKQKAGIN